MNGGVFVNVAPRRKAPALRRASKGGLDDADLIAQEVARRLTRIPHPFLLGALHLGAACFLAAYWLIYGLSFAGQDFIDAKSYWLAARLVWVEGVSPYAPGFAAAAEEAGIGFAHPYVYPPPSLILFAPIGALDYQTAALALLAGNHVALLLIAWGMARWLAPAGWVWEARLTAPLYAALFAIFAAQATRVTLGHGQVNLIVLAGLVWLLAARAGRAPAWIGAAGLIVATLLKPYVALFALFLLAPEGRRMLPAAFLGTGVLIALTVLLAPVEIWPDWLTHFALKAVEDGLYLGAFDVLGPENLALSRQLASFGDLSQGFAALALIPIALLFLYAGDRALAAKAAALFAFIFLFAPLSWTHYAVYAVAGGAFAGLSAWRGGRRGIAAGYGVLVLSLLQTPPSLPDWPTAAIAALYIWALLDGFRAPRAPLSPPLST